MVSPIHVFGKSGGGLQKGMKNFKSKLTLSGQSESLLEPAQQ
jgi:hypothetical protein